MKDSVKIGIVIPVLNEPGNLYRLLMSLENQSAPELITLIVIAAGDSDIKKYEDMKASLCGIRDKINILHNMKRFTPFALNLGINECIKKDIGIIQFLGAHSMIGKGFVSNLHRNVIENPDIQIFNSSLEFTGAESYKERAIQLFTYSRLGRNWKNFFQSSSGSGFITGIFAIRSEVLKDIGLFDERFRKNQDIQFVKRALTLGFRAEKFSNLVYYYKVRPTITAALKQMFITGRYVAIDIRSVNLKQLAPFIFYSVVALLLIFGYLTSARYPGIILLMLVSAYLLVILGESVSFLLRRNKEAFLLPLLFVSSHLVYAAGTVFGFLRKVIKTDG